MKYTICLLIGYLNRHRSGFKNLISQAVAKSDRVSGTREGARFTHLAPRANFCQVALVLPLLSGLFPGTTSGDETPSGNLQLIELYTSHGCSSCPSADKLLGELLEERDDLLALEFHVDYWNNLVHGRDGNFVDPFSQVSHSMRQREYNAANLKGRPGVYTPQVVVNGRFAAVGSNRRHIIKALDRPVEQLLKVLVEPGEDDTTLTVRIDGSEKQLASLHGTDILLASYLDKASTLITGGENRDKTLTNHRIVTSLQPIGEVSADEGMVFSLPRPGKAEGCIILVQESAQTPVFAAAACP